MLLFPEPRTPLPRKQSSPCSIPSWDPWCGSGQADMMGVRDPCGSGEGRPGFPWETQKMGIKTGTE